VSELASTVGAEYPAVSVAIRRLDHRAARSRTLRDMQTRLSATSACGLPAATLAAQAGSRASVCRRRGRRLRLPIGSSLLRLSATAGRLSPGWMTHSPTTTPNRSWPTRTAERSWQLRPSSFRASGRLAASSGRTGAAPARPEEAFSLCLLHPARLWYLPPPESAPSGRSQRASARAARKAISCQSVPAGKCPCRPKSDFLSVRVQFSVDGRPGAEQAPGRWSLV
jgi:hypothetical protein